VTSDRWPAAEPVIIAGDGLVLREWTEADLPTMVELFDEPSVDRWTPLESPFDSGAARRYLSRAAVRRREGAALQFAITEAAGPPLGELLIFDQDEPSDQGAVVGELGYSVGLRYRGRGLASRAVRLATAQAAIPWGFQLLRLRIEVGNVASERVAAACGFARTTQPLEAVWSQGRAIELTVWERDPDRERVGDTRPARLGLK
jgi:RimJ/RimL family protein N-acetyltransferase